MNKSYSKIRHIQETNQRLEKTLINEQANQRVQPLVDFLKKNSYTATEIQQALATLKISLPAPTTQPTAQQKTTTQQTTQPTSQQSTQSTSGYGYINNNLKY
jgi:hypothetical protein